MSLIAVVIAAIVVFTRRLVERARRQNIPAAGSLTNALTLPGSAEVAAMYKGIPQQGTTLGSATGDP